MTVRKDEGFPLEPLLRRWDRSTDLGENGVAFLVYGLLDLVIDGYFATIDAFDEYYDTISEEHLLGAADRAIAAAALVRRCAGLSCSSTGSFCRCARS